MVQNKYRRHKKELKKCCSKLLAVLYWLAWKAESHYGVDTLTTSVYRSEKEQRKICEKIGKKYYATVHTYYRGIDVIFPKLSIKKYKVLADMVNQEFPYGKGRYKTAYVHKGTGWHMHLQTAAEGQA